MKCTPLVQDDVAPHYRYAFRGAVVDVYLIKYVKKGAVVEVYFIKYVKINPSRRPHCLTKQSKNSHLTCVHKCRIQRPVHYVSCRLLPVTFCRLKITLLFSYHVV